ncbi:MAG: glycosyltransferase [Syntrophaceae bacterium]
MDIVKANAAPRPASTGWDFFDRIYCISLEEREDRRRAAQAQFAKVGLQGKIEFLIVRRHPLNVEQGIYESHMACLRRGLEAGAGSIAVFEDDVVFDRFDAGRLARCTRFLAKNPQWQVLLFGALIRSSRKTAEPAVQKVGYQSLAHAYALNRHYAESIAYKPWDGVVADVIFRPLEHVYAVKPMFAFQGDMFTDNKYRGLEIFRRLLGGLENIQKANEFFYQNLYGIIAAHLIVLASLGLLYLAD